MDCSCVQRAFGARKGDFGAALRQDRGEENFLGWCCAHDLFQTLEVQRCPTHPGGQTAPAPSGCAQSIFLSARAAISSSCAPRLSPGSILLEPSEEAFRRPWNRCGCFSSPPEEQAIASLWSPSIPHLALFFFFLL